MTNFLLELMSEEMPASIIKDSAVSIEQLFCNSFKKDNLTYDSYNIYYGPKRITLIFFNLKNIIDEVYIKGPNVKAPIVAIEGFARSQKVAIDDLDIKRPDSPSIIESTKPPSATKIAGVPIENASIGVSPKGSL